MAASILLPVLLAIAVSSAQTKLYEGDAQVILSRQNLANALTDTPDPSAAANDFIRIVQTQADVARSPAVAQNVLDKAGLPDVTTEEFLNSSSVEPARDADILTFKVTDEQPDQATLLANLYANEFTAYRQMLDTNALQAAREEIRKRLNSSAGDSKAVQESLVAKLQELQTLETLQTSNAAVISGAEEATQVSPRWVRNLALAIVFGFGLAAFAAWVRETLDTRVRTPEEVGELLNVPLLGRIGPPPPELEGELQMAAQPYGPDAEVFRALRTNVEFATLDSSIKVIMITSAVEAEGKSTTIANLALAFARSGKNVALLDLDLRKLSLPPLFGLRSDAGITDVGIGRLDLESALQPVEITTSKRQADGSVTKTLSTVGSVQLLQGGSTPPDPGEFLGSPTVAGVIEQLTERFDLVLIDAPPVLPVGDVLAVSPAVDAVVLTVRVPAVRRPMLTALAQSLARAPSKVLGFVVTGDLPRGAGFYGYGAGEYESAFMPSDAQIAQRS